MNRFVRPIPVLLGTGALALAACSHCPTPPPPPPPQQVVCVPPAPVAPPPAAVTAPAPAKPDNVIVVKDVGFETPESVLWDGEQDLYLVANINGKPTAVDGNGFISKLGPDGKVVALKWIDGSKKGSELNAPKGMAVAGKLLFVADLDTIRKFDRKTGKPKGKIDVKGATFLNGLAVSPDGKMLYASDSGVKIDDNGFSGTGTDAIYEIDLKKKKSVKPLVQDKALHWPNGLLADDTGLWSVSLAGKELIHVSYKGELGAVTKLAKGSLDGIARLPDRSLLISSWEAQAVYRGVPGGEFSELVSGVPSPAAIGLDTKRTMLLIPIFGGNAVEIHKLPVLPIIEMPETPPPAAPAKEGPKAPGATEIPEPPSARAPTAAPAAAPAPAPAPAPAAAPAPAPAPVPAPARVPAAGAAPTKWE